jgi:hypothetical protein
LARLKTRELAARTLRQLAVDYGLSGVADARCKPQWRRVHTYTRAIGLLDEIKRLLTGAKDDAETHAQGGEPVATPPGEEERETSTNAQMMGSSDEPWSGNN